MTVITIKQGNFNYKSKAIGNNKISRKSDSSTIFWKFWPVNVFLLFSIIFSLALYCFWVADFAGSQMDIQNLEKTTLILEEKNADLKTVWSQEINSHNVEGFATEANLLREKQPKYMSSAIIDESKLAQN